MKPQNIVLILCALFTSVYSQGAAFEQFNTSRYARVIAMGNAYTGLADDIESVYYNSAGLARLDYYAFSYSNGQGFIYIINQYTADNFALLVPVSAETGTFAFSMDRFNFDSDNFNHTLYRLHWAREVFDKLAIGASINYYRLTIDGGVVVGQETGGGGIIGNAIDFSISTLYEIPVMFIPGNNQIRIGMQMQNLLDTKLDYSNGITDDPKHQVLRSGFSAIMIPDLPAVGTLTPLKIIVAADAVFYGKKYDFILWQPNFGIEISLLEILNLRYGRENELEIKNYYSYSAQHPVKRYGIGLQIPLHKIISGYERLIFYFDYSYSDWDQINEANFYGLKSPITESFSLKLSFQL